LATIYKNLNAMVDNGFVKEVKIIGQDSRYELSKAPHSHIVCKECGVVEDILLDDTLIKDEATKISSFKIDSSSITFYGICKKCQ
jgi:Fur family peroxide stress response transcriptional regulator